MGAKGGPVSEPDEDVLEMVELFALLEKANDPVIDLIINKCKVCQDGYTLFYRLHESREDKDDDGRLGVARKFQAKRDICVELLEEIVYARGKANG